MSLVLSHQTALRLYQSPVILSLYPYFQMNEAGDVHAVKPPKRVQLKACSAPTMQEALALSNLISNDKPLFIHTIVDHANKRRMLPGVQFHKGPGALGVVRIDTSTLFEKDTASIPCNYYLCTPEELFLQMANQLPFLDLLQLGFEFCGTYVAERPETIASFLHRPYTSTSKLSQFMDSPLNQGRRGISQAKEAIRFLQDRAASPREASLFMMLTLPCRRGGYGLPKPQINYRIEIPRNMKHIIRSRYFVCDLYWPEANLAIEYDSDKYHTGAKKIAKDSSRRDALSILNVNVITVTNQQIGQLAEMDSLAFGISKRLGTRYRTDHQYDYAARKQRLRIQLLRQSSNWIPNP